MRLAAAAVTGHGIMAAGPVGSVLATREERALLAAGALGGPLTIGMYTPLRNAITLGAKDPTASAAALYRLTVRHGWLRGGYAGWLSPTAFSAAQFVAIGPLYHVYADVVGPSLAVVPTALTESAISYGSQARNAQIAYNLSVGEAQRVALQAPWDPRGAGFAAHVCRNLCAMSGIRVLSPPLRAMLGVDDGGASPTALFAADFAASILAAAASMPFNQLFNFLCTTPPAARPDGLLRACTSFLRSQYLTPSGGLSAVVLRDAFMRCAYIAPQLSTYSAIERFARQTARRADEQSARSER